MRLSWQRSILEPLTANVVYDEIVAGNQGYITSADVALHPRPARPMESDRLAAVRRQQYLLNPRLLLWDAFRRQRDTGHKVIKYAGLKELDGIHCKVIEISAFPRPFRLFADPGSNRISRLVTWENDCPRGDIEIAVTFSDWRRDSGHDFPYKVELSIEGVVIHREIRRRIEVEPRLNPDIFVLPETLPFDQKDAESGLMNEQWIHRCIAMGAPISLHAGKVVPTPITPNVVTMGGGTHHSLAIALDREVVVVDSPQHENRSLAVIGAIKAAWPGKPIKHLILTHHHYDHSGGIRAFSAIGAELIMAQGDRDFIAQCLARPYTICPDTLATAPVRPAIRTVADDSLIMGKGEIVVRRISSPHSAENLVVYAAGAKLLFNADLFNPGLVPPGVPPPPCWLAISRDFRRQLKALDLDIKIMLGAHGVTDGRPYQSLIDFTE